MANTPHASSSYRRVRSPTQVQLSVKMYHHAALACTFSRKASDMRSTFWLKGICICALIVSLCVPVRADDGSTAPVNYASGDIAVSTAACGPLCATITLANGDTVKVLAGRATGCALHGYFNAISWRTTRRDVDDGARSRRRGQSRFRRMRFPAAVPL